MHEAAPPGSVGEEVSPGNLVPEERSLKSWMGRAEIDTSSPFESVAEAVTRFGGSAPWKPQQQQQHGQQFPFDPEKQHSFGEVDIATVEAETVELEKHLIVKEQETLDVLKELEMTKKMVYSLKLELEKEAFEVFKIPEKNPDIVKVHPIVGTEEASARLPENHMNLVGPSADLNPSAELILMELKQAKSNLTRTTSDLAEIRASVESLHSKIESEKISLEKSRERLISDSAKVSSSEEELNQTRIKLQLVENAENNGCGNPPDISEELRHMSSEAREFKNMEAVTKSDILKMTDEIEQMKARIKTSEIRWLAVKKMEAAARAAETAALTEIKALNNSENSTADLRNPSGITLSAEEYGTLAHKAQQAEELSTTRIEAAMAQLDEANKSKLDLLKKIEEASAELKYCRKSLEEALNRVEAANRGKLAVEEALRRWRSEHGQKRRSIHSSAKFKNSRPSHHRRDSRTLDVNGYSSNADASKNVMRPTLSIGQILSRKLMGPEESEMVTHTQESTQLRQNVTLGQMLSRRHADLSPKGFEDRAPRKQSPAKRKKFGFVGFSLILAKNKNRKKKRHAWSPK